MKSLKFLFLFFIATAFFNCDTSKKANSNSNTPVSQRRGNQGDMEAKMEALITKLDLSGTQESKFRAINDKYSQKMEALRQNSKGGRQAMMEVKEKQSKEMQSLLSKEQFEVYKAETQRQGGKRGGF